jgi:site-specific DNA-methyltransferase (adenine-specific)
LGIEIFLKLRIIMLLNKRIKMEEKENERATAFDRLINRKRESVHISEDEKRALLSITKDKNNETEIAVNLELFLACRGMRRKEIASNETPADKKIENNLKTVETAQDHIVIVGDCMKELDKLPNGKFKLIFADPPYNMGKKFGNNVDSWNSAEDYAAWCEAWIDKCIDKLTYDGSLMIMGHPRYASYLVPHLDKKLVYVNQIIYYYTDGMPEKKNFERRYEVILFYRKDKDNYTFNIDAVRTPLVRYDKLSNPLGKNPNDVWQINRVRWNSSERISSEDGSIAHATQKPIRLMRRIILATSNEGDLILDPFLGTGTTSVAAKELGRKSVGIELNPDYAKIALDRLDNTNKFDRSLEYEER